MKSKYPKEYSNLKKMDINILKRRNELSSSRSFDSQERCELRLENENQTLLTSNEALRYLESATAR